MEDGDGLAFNDDLAAYNDELEIVDIGGFTTSTGKVVHPTYH